jgi:hypothetical protein
VARKAAARLLRLADAMVALSPERWAKWCTLSRRLRVEIPDLNLQALLTEEEAPRYVLKHSHRLILRLSHFGPTARKTIALYNEMLGELFAAGTAGLLDGSYYNSARRRREPVTAEHWAGRLEPVPYFGLGTMPGVVGLGQGRLWFPGDPLTKPVDIPVAERIDLEADELRPWPGLVLPDVLISLRAAADRRPPGRTPDPIWQALWPDVSVWLAANWPLEKRGGLARLERKLQDLISERGEDCAESTARLWATRYIKRYRQGR